MKTIIAIIAVSLVCFSACTKQETDPILEIYVTTKASDKWTDLEINIDNVRLVEEAEDGGTINSSLQRYTGSSFNVSLLEDQTVLIYNDSHFEYEKLEGARFIGSSFILTFSDSGLQQLPIPFHDPILFDEQIRVENGKTYRIDFTIDLDELVVEENGALTFIPDYEVIIVEL